MDYEKKIEIPFGAKDSELCECEYTIPEGYETEIKDGKVIIRKKESEDEKTRKSLLKYLKDMCKSTSTPFSLADAKLWIVWLEKQGEQKSVVIPKFRVGDMILAEIERLRSDFPKVINQKEEDCQWLYWRGLNKIRDFINSLPEEPVSEEQVKESAEIQHVSRTCKENGDSLTQKPVSEDLEEASRNYGDELDNVLSVGIDDDNTVGEYAAQAYKAGAQWDRQLLMKDAISCSVSYYDSLFLNYTQDQQDAVLDKLGAQVGDMVKVIILKDE